MQLPRIETRRDDVVDDYHGALVADPYRWLEDADAPETVAWVAAQNARTRAFLDATPARARIQARLTQLWNFPRYGTPQKAGDWRFFTRNDGLQNQAVLYAQHGPEGSPRVLLDPNTLSDDGTVALTGVNPSRDGSKLAWAVSSSGSDWQEIRIRDVATGEDLPEVLRWCKFAGIGWAPDHSGFFYNRLPQPGSVPAEDENRYSRVHFHTLGTDQSADPLVYDRPDDKDLLFYPEVSDDGRWLVLNVHVGTDPRSRVYIRPVAGGDVVRLLDDFDAAYEFIDNDGDTFFFKTDLDAPRGRVIALDLARPGREHWREVIPQGDETLALVESAGGRFVTVSLHHAQHRMRVYSRSGSLEREIELPGIGSIDALSAHRDDDEFFFGFTSFLAPSTPYRCDVTNGALVRLQHAALDFDTDAYTTTQVFAPSKDGTPIPMFLLHRKGLELHGDNPTLLYGYGGFNIALTPNFAVHRLLWIEQGGVYAIANLRGGDEYGEEWHQAGMLERKQNVFDDFIGCAEWLIANGYTSSRKLAINGSSNGGLLVAACLTQRPDLFGAVVCEVPVIDMLRYHKFTVGHFWVPEYGNAEANPEHFRFLYAYSPLHNVRDGVSWPPVLITSADTDDRVVPAHAKKFAAALQATQRGAPGEAPILLRVETKAGHGMGKPTSKVIEERADVYAFLAQVFGMDM
ncbi:MAG: S9 family peptidase [Chloroflexi bacterium]|nr:MAG: S9 family peptidase [Chloroflexota bacterium]